MKFKGNQEDIKGAQFVEVRGIVNKDHTVTFGEMTKYENDFDLNAYE